MINKIIKTMPTIKERVPGTGGREGETMTPSGSLRNSGRVAGVRGSVAAGVGSPATVVEISGTEDERPVSIM